MKRRASIHSPCRVGGAFRPVAPSFGRAARRRCEAAVFSVAVLWGAPAAAQDYRFPFGGSCTSSSCYVTAYYDLVAASGSMQDWNCGRHTYDGHHGTDFGVGSWPGMDAGRDIVAAADGEVIQTHDGEFDRCTSGDCPGGSGYGNHVRLRHADGKVTIYGHMKNGSVAVSVGQHVRCGDRLGQVGSSGYSTGPHLHFEVRTAGGSADDPYTGPCGGPLRYWVDQGAYNGLPSTECDGAATDGDGDGSPAGEDCDDGNPDVHPGAAEACNGRDDDCDGSTDEGLLNRCGACGPEPPETCGDALDNDCDGLTDEECGPDADAEADAESETEAETDAEGGADADAEAGAEDVGPAEGSGDGSDGEAFGYWVFVEEGCGCAAPGGAASGGWLVLWFVSVAVARRRRRARPVESRRGAVGRQGGAG